MSLYSSVKPPNPPSKKEQPLTPTEKSPNPNREGLPGRRVGGGTR